MCHGQIVSTKVVRAQREAKPCAMCDRAIPKGAEYVMHSVRSYGDDKVSSWKLCRRCGVLWAAWWGELDMDSCPFDIHEAVRDAIQWDSWPALRRSLESARERLRIGDAERRRREQVRREWRKKRQEVGRDA